MKYSKRNGNTEKLFFPINIANCHWVLAYANIKTLEFSVMDPFKEVEGLKLQTYFKNFLKFWSSETGTNIDELKQCWKTKRISHPCQTDSYNCGVFVMYFINQLMSNDSIDMSFDPSDFRNSCYRNLLATSKDMINKCLICRRTFHMLVPSAPEHESVECTSCLRWFHVATCLPNDVQKDIKILSGDEYKFFCSLCRLYYQKYISR
jgi:hypothetical protein